LKLIKQGNKCTVNVYWFGINEVPHRFRSMKRVEIEAPCPELEAPFLRQVYERKAQLKRKTRV